MHVRILFMFCACIHIIKTESYDTDEAKYIDLLPEQEKREFLERIARRIMAEIKSRDVVEKTSIEISDERLNEHAAYVKKIMDEETESLKTQRRTNDDNISENVKHPARKNDDFIELNVTPPESNGEKVQEAFDNVGLSASENKIRIKKGTTEDNKDKSEGNVEGVEHTVSEIPVHLLYDGEDNLQSTVNSKKLDNSDYAINDHLDNTGLGIDSLSVLKLNNKNQVSLEKIHRSSNQEINNSKKGSRENQPDENLKMVRDNIDVHENMFVPTAKPQTMADDFDPKQEEFDAYYNNTAETSSERPNVEKINLDGNLQKSTEIYVENVTEDYLQTSTVEPTRNLITVLENSYPSMDNVLNSSEPAYDNEYERRETISPRNLVKYISNVPETYLQAATPSYDFHIDIDNKGSIDAVASTIKARSVTKKYQDRSTSNENVIKESTEDRTASSRSVLRVQPNNLQDHVERLRILTDRYSFSSNGNHPVNRYKVFDAFHEKPPFVSSNQINTGYIEAPYYVPIYDYAPKNAFYNAYNRFGPNYENNIDPIETAVPHYYDKELSYEVIKHNSEPKYERAHLNEKNGKGKKGRGQRKFKHYRNGNRYKKDKKVTYQKNLVPIKKGRLLNINSHGNDYLDIDYYLGRSNDSPEYFNDDFTLEAEKDFIRFYPEYTSGSDIDSSLGINLYNMKNYIRNIRNKVNLQRNHNKTKTMTLNDDNRNLRDKLNSIDRILTNPIFKGLNSSLVIFIPKTRTKKRPQETRDKNISVDYYFSRMSSGESDLYTDNQETTLNRDKNLQYKDKHLLETNTKGKHTVVREQKFQFPLELDNLLKIDVAMRDNEVNVMFREVKKSTRNHFDLLLDAYLNVLKDMIEHDSKGLMQYDWLGSTVDVQSALKKLIDLTDIMHVSDDIHRSDLELFRYVLFLYKTSMKSLMEAAGIRRSANERNQIDKPSSKRKMMPTIDFNQFEAWREVRKYMQEMRELNIDVYDYLLKQFGLFLNDLREHLNELHETVKEIAAVTKYNRQRWYLDLKELYLSPLDRKVSLNLLLHLAATRLFGLIEESAQNGLEKNFVEYVRSHTAEVERTREEFIFVLRLLKAINRLKN